MEKDILLLESRLFGNQFKILMDYLPDEHWQKIWNTRLDHCTCKDVYFIGSELALPLV